MSQDSARLVRSPVQCEGIERGPKRIAEVAASQYEARVRELIEDTYIVFSTMIGTMLDVRRAIFEAFSIILSQSTTFTRPSVCSFVVCEVPGR
jgi:hypothetical protein